MSADNMVRIQLICTVSPLEFFTIAALVSYRGVVPYFGIYCLKAVYRASS